MKTPREILIAELSEGRSKTMRKLIELADHI